MSYLFKALPADVCAAWRAGAPDANGQPPERVVSDGGNPCRCCLDEISKGQGMLILACRPFTAINPYAEIGPIFLCETCERHADSAVLPPVLAHRPRHWLKGYSKDHRIVYGTGEIVDTADIDDYFARTFARAEVAYVHARSASNNCYTLKIARA